MILVKSSYEKQKKLSYCDNFVNNSVLHVTLCHHTCNKCNLINNVTRVQVIYYFDEKKLLMTRTFLI